MREGRALLVVEILKTTYPGARTALEFGSPWELLVAVVLSAQSTDLKTNEITRRLFKKYPTVGAYAEAPLDRFEQDVRSSGYYRAKAKHIIAAAQALEEHFHGEMPRRMEDMLKLPGIGRKSANVILGSAYGVAEGIAVDTHVFRVAGRLDLSDAATPEQMERDLMRLIPTNDWITFSFLLIDHGRQICTARLARCDKCPVNHICPSAFKCKACVKR